MVLKSSESDEALKRYERHDPLDTRSSGTDTSSSDSKFSEFGRSILGVRDLDTRYRGNFCVRISPTHGPISKIIEKSCSTHRVTPIYVIFDRTIEGSYRINLQTC